MTKPSPLAGILLGLAAVITITAVLLHRPGTPSTVQGLPTRGLDTGLAAVRLAGSGRDLPAAGVNRGWLRVRGVDLGKVEESRANLLEIRKLGLHSCVFLRRRGVANWRHTYLPDSLHDAYDYARQVGATFGDVVDAWEVDNEPDLGYVPELPERYTAFLKASYLGLQHGIAEALAKPASTQIRSGPLAHGNSHESAGLHVSIRGFLDKVFGRKSQVSPRGPLVLLGGLGLPPGPWLERFAANDGFAYTDGFNYHYYGYAEDFTGVYRQFEAAATELSAKHLAHRGPLPPHPADALNSDGTQVPRDGTRRPVILHQKSLPVFLTEIGYGMLGNPAYLTKEGRLRQWQWFKRVGEQTDSLGIEAPMAFYLPPYLSSGVVEYGLTTPAQPSLARPATSDRRSQKWSAGGIEYEASDFASSHSAAAGTRAPGDISWMNRIGTQVGGNELTPAGAWWLGAERGGSGRQGKTFYLPSKLRRASRAWTVSAPPPSPIVLDFLAGEGLSAIKRYNGHFVTSRTPVSQVNPAAAGHKLEAEKPKGPVAQPSPPARTEGFILHVRTANGNLYEVYPTRQAKSEWQHFLEPRDNLSMSSYGRAELPWRFEDNQPLSLVIALYAKQLPATFEFRRPQLLRLGEPRNAGAGAQKPEVFRHGRGKIVLYNFGDTPVQGTLVLPLNMSLAPMTMDSPGAEVPGFSHPAPASFLVLAPMERRLIDVTVTVPAERYDRFPAEIVFTPETPDARVSDLRPSLSVDSPSRFRTDFIPDIAGMKPTSLGRLLPAEQAPGSPVSGDRNRGIVANRPRATEEPPTTEQGGFFASGEVQVSALTPQPWDSFSITVPAISPGKLSRIEVEIPWPEGLSFPHDAFLSLHYRLRQD